MHKLAFLTALLQVLVLVFSPGAFAQDEERADWLDIELGKSVVLETPKIPTAIAITDPEVANVVSLGVANKIQVQGTSIGTTDLVVQFGPGIPPMIYEITVHRDLSDLIRRVDAIVEGEPPRVYPLRDRIVIQGPVADLDTLEQVALVARVYDPEFVNLMTVKGDHQVQLEVVFAEVSRSGLRELGVNAFLGRSEVNAGIIGPTPLGGPVVVESVVDTINGGLIPYPSAGGFGLLAFVPSIDLGVVLGVLDQNKLSKILARPTIVSLSGQQAEFLAGGEIPIPAPTGTGTIAIEYKEYGIKLVFVPTVLAGNVVNMIIYTEVSEIDQSTSTTITGIEVPGFITRKGSSHLRIESGMSFAMAGLLDEQINFTRAEIPGLGRIPLIGALFRTVVHERTETELVIYVTPRLVRPMAAGELPPPPGSAENNKPSDLELFLLGADRRPGSRSAQPTKKVGLSR